MADGSGRRVREMAVYLGEATNNVAETCALILALQTALQMGHSRVKVSTDSELLARQVTGLYRVKDRRLQWLHTLIRNLQPGFETFEIHPIPREENRKADRLANRAVLEGLKTHSRAHRKSVSCAIPSTVSQPTLF